MDSPNLHATSWQQWTDEDFNISIGFCCNFALRKSFSMLLLELKDEFCEFDPGINFTRYSLLEDFSLF